MQILRVGLKFVFHQFNQIKEIFKETFLQILRLQSFPRQAVSKLIAGSAIRLINL